ncbi:hypothetical protein ABMA28_004432 [Loxostege sticticalis]|uniref:Reverse transcriptase domain-containing protein n=1 Tax=Loxostege sticticalis TaxID=481309 RepID=A0ABD0SR58_LOXSC
MPLHRSNASASQAAASVNRTAPNPRRDRLIVLYPRRVISLVELVILNFDLIIVGPRRANKCVLRKDTLAIIVGEQATLEAPFALVQDDRTDMVTNSGPIAGLRPQSQTRSPMRQIKRENLDSLHRVTGFRAGQLTKFIAQWEEMGAPNYILQIIKGYRIPFALKPPLAVPNLQKSPLNIPRSPIMTQIIEQMKKERVLEVVEQLTPSFLSTIFLVQKDAHSYRSIFNLKTLNAYVLTERFKLINMGRVPDFLQPHDWLCKIDISQAYFHVAITKAQRRFLRLIYDGELLEMTCLPFGLSTAPKVFASITNWVAQILRQQGIRIIVFIDDFLLAHQDATMLTSQVCKVVETLKYLGWQINVKKCQLVPQKHIVYLGIHWDPWLNHKCLPQEKHQGCVNKIAQVLQKRTVTLKELQSLVGLLNFASFVVPNGRLNYRHLLGFLNTIPKISTQEVYVLTEECLLNLMWWLQNYKMVSPIHYPTPTHYLTTDASDIAWGAKLNNWSLSGPWSDREQALHSNQKELLAVLKVLQTNCQSLINSTILLQCDNKTTVAYLRNQGGTKSPYLMDLTYKVYEILDQYQIHLIPHYLPGRFNAHADSLSRHRQTAEWHLLPHCTQKIFDRFGIPVIDLFASKTAHVVANYVSLDMTDDQAIYHDAFSRIWDYHLAWIFPPPFLIPRILTHLNQAKGCYLLVVPRWERVFWRADLKQRAIAPPFTIANLSNCLVDTVTQLPPPKVDEMIMEVWKCGAGLKT